MATQPKSRPRRLNIRLSQEEFEKIQELSSNTTCRSVSEYSRKVLLNKPVKVFYRNKSFDDFEERMIRIMPILEGYDEKFNQLIQRLSPPKCIPEIAPYITLLFNAQRPFIKSVEEIKEHLIILSDQCAQK